MPANDHWKRYVKATFNYRTSEFFYEFFNQSTEKLPEHIWILLYFCKHFVKLPIQALTKLSIKNKSKSHRNAFILLLLIKTEVIKHYNDRVQISIALYRHRNKKDRMNKHVRAIVELVACIFYVQLSKSMFKIKINTNRLCYYQTSTMVICYEHVYIHMPLFQCLKYSTLLWISNSYLIY